MKKQILICAVLLSFFSAQTSEKRGALYSSLQDSIRPHQAKLTIPKTLGKLRTLHVEEFGEGPDVQVRMKDRESTTVTIISIYKAEKGTVVPKLFFDKNGKLKLMD